MNSLKKFSGLALAFLLTMGFLSGNALASEIDLKIPSLDVGYNIFGHAITGSQILFYGMWICVLGMIFGFWEFIKIKKMPAHKSMLAVSHTIYETCKTYMKQQAKLLVILELFIAACIFYYFFYLNATPLPKVMTVLMWSILGILGSYAVAWFGMRINTYGDYNKDGWRVPNRSAMPWERNNFRGAFELKSANGNFGIRIEVQQGRNTPY